MKIAIVGSRRYPHLGRVRDYINSLPEDTVIVSGGAVGVDEMAEITAKERGLETIIFRADWKRFGRGAGMVRNHDIVNAADKVVAFWDGKSDGTRNSIELARQAGKPVEIVYLRRPS